MLGIVDRGAGALQNAHLVIPPVGIACRRLHGPELLTQPCQ